jgi:hypothetical protein
MLRSGRSPRGLSCGDRSSRNTEPVLTCAVLRPSRSSVAGLLAVAGPRGPKAGANLHPVYSTRRRAPEPDCPALNTAPRAHDQRADARSRAGRRSPRRIIDHGRPTGSMITDWVPGTLPDTAPRARTPITRSGTPASANTFRRSRVSAAFRRPARQPGQHRPAPVPDVLPQPLDEGALEHGPRRWRTPPNCPPRRARPTRCRAVPA